MRVGLSADRPVERVSFGDSYTDFYGYNREVYLTHFDDGVQGFISTSDTSGKLRLVWRLYLDGVQEWIQY